MFNLVLINGCGGAGKDTAGRLLLKALRHCALLDIKTLSQTNPWSFDEYHLGLKNAATVIKNYFEFGFPTVIFTGGLSSQDRLIFFQSLLPPSSRLFYVWLDVPKQIRDPRRISRSRDEADQHQCLDQVDSVFTDPGTLTIVGGKYLRIDAERLSPADVVARIQTELNSDG
jgi:hypothetical protein